MQKQLASTRHRERLPSQAAIMNIPDVDQPPEQKVSVALHERVLFLVQESQSVSELDATEEQKGYQSLSNHTLFLAASAEHALVMGDDDLEISAHEWARRTPKTIEQAVRGPLAVHWLRSINKERASLFKNEVLGPPL